MNKRVLIAITIICSLLAVSVVCWFLLNTIAFENPVAKIYQDGKILYEIDLNRVSEEYTIKITNDNGGENTVQIKHGEIGVCDSNCPDKTCVHTGFISNGSIPIICIPNKLEIRIVNGASSTDGVSR